jgi:hypothetical protein
MAGGGTGFGSGFGVFGRRETNEEGGECVRRWRKMGKKEEKVT